MSDRGEAIDKALRIVEDEMKRCEGGIAALHESREMRLQTYVSADVAYEDIMIEGLQKRMGTLHRSWRELVGHSLDVDGEEFEANEARKSDSSGPKKVLAKQRTSRLYSRDED